MQQLLYFRFAAILAISFNCSLAEQSEIPWPALDTKLPIWEPQHTGDQRLPAIIYYHGTNGTPSIQLLRQVGAHQHFLLVGMTYVNPGRFVQSESNIAQELTQLTKLKTILTEQYHIDPERIYVAGFSKGGWFAATLLERDRSLAGGLILGAGVFHARQASPPKAFKSKKPIFIGVGRFDGNYPQSLRALVHFRKLGATVTLEAWPNAAHEYPKETPLSMQQWLQLQAEGAEASKASAQQWLAGQRRQIRQLASPVDQWHAYQTLTQRPFTQAFDTALARALKRDTEALLKKPAVQSEQALLTELQDILRSESRDRYVTTLESALKRYETLIAKAEGSRIASIAQLDAQRIRKLLTSAPRAR